MAVVRDGTVVQVARPADLYERPVDLTTARFVGDAVELDARAAADGWVTCALGEVEVPDARAGASGLLVLRPEQLGLVAESEGAGALGTVRTRSYHGHDCVLLVRLDAGAEVPVRVPGSRSAEPGDRVGVVVDGGGRLFAQPDA